MPPSLMFLGLAAAVVASPEPQPPVPAALVGIGTPRGVAADRAGNVYVVSETLGRIFKVDPSGQLTTLVSTSRAEQDRPVPLPYPPRPSGLIAPVGIAVEESGDLLVADREARRIFRVDRSGTTTVVVGGGEQRLLAPVAVAVLPGGDIVIVDRGDHRLLRVTAGGGTITAVVGDAIPGFRGDGGPASNARLDSPEAVAVDHRGNIYVADRGNRCVRKVAAATGIITTVADPRGMDPTGVAVDRSGQVFVADETANRLWSVSPSGAISVLKTVVQGPYALATAPDGTLVVSETKARRVSRLLRNAPAVVVAGTGGVGYGGDGRPARDAFLRSPQGLALDGRGNLYIADMGNHRIRRIDAATGVITTVAGNGSAGFDGDGGPAVAAMLHRPHAVAVDREGNVLIADTGNNRVRRMDTKGLIRTVSASGEPSVPSAVGIVPSFNPAEPRAVAVDGSGNVFFSEAQTHVVRRIAVTDGAITTVAGGEATSVALEDPADLAVDGKGALWIADQGAHRVYRVEGGRIETVAGDGVDAATGDGGPAAQARVGNFLRIATDDSGNLWIGDGKHYRIRRVDAGNGLIATVAGSGAAGQIKFGEPATETPLSPLGIAVAKDGSLFLTDHRSRVLRVTPLGRLEIFAGGGFGF